MSDLHIPSIGPHISLQQNRQTAILEIYKSLTDIRVYRNLETDHYNSVLEITGLISGNKKMGTTFIHIGFSPALHLHCSAMEVDMSPGFS